MKHYLAYILIFLPFYCLNSMDQDQEQNKFLVCNQIKQINPHASRATYLELAEKLSKNKLSVCACMTYLMQEREKRALGLIANNFASEETANVVKKLYNQQQQKDANEKNGIPLTIHCSPSIDPATQKSIAEKFSGKYRTIIVPTEEFCAPGTDLCVHRDIEMFAMKSDPAKLTRITAENPKMGINALFKIYSPNARNAVLEHERCHLKENHAILEILLDTSLCNNSRYHPRRDTLDEREEKILLKLHRAHEAAADRIPAACNDCKLASDFVEWHDIVTKMFNYLNKNNTLSPNNDKFFQYHPSIEKRLRWSWRIYKLKLAEREIENEMTKNMDEGHRNSTIFWLF